MYPMNGVGFMGRKKGGDIPVPEAGVCTVYPIAIPVTSGLIHYSSPFNWCDQYNDLAGTTPIGLSGSVWANSADLSGSNPQLAGNSGTRPMQYIDDGGGDVYWKGGPISGSIRFSTVNPAWRLNTDVKTILYLCVATNIASNGDTRLGINGPGTQLRFNGGNISVFDGANRDSSIAGANGVLQVCSIRTDNNIVLGVDKTYQNVKATPPTVASADFGIWSPNGSGSFIGKCRDVAIFDRALSDAEVDTMVDYMKAKWNL